MRLLLIILLLLCLTSGCAFRRITRTKNITYSSLGTASQRLNVFAPRNKRVSHPVLVFIHGGNWTAGRKELYNWLGSRLARKGIVAVIIDYPLSPAAKWRAMAEATAQALSWTEKNIGPLGGDPRRLYVSGHSAGGHLAAVLATDASFLQAAGSSADSIKGLVLIDAAGLDMYGYLKDEGGLAEEPSYATTFTRDTAEWKRATPLYHLHRGMPPFLILRGGRSYPSIIRSNERFVQALKARRIEPLQVMQPRRKHIPMITQFFNTGNPRYRDILRFMGE